MDDVDLPTLHSLKGMAPDCTGGMPAADWVRHLRDTGEPPEIPGSYYDPPYPDGGPKPLPIPGGNSPPAGSPARQADALHALADALMRQAAQLIALAGEIRYGQVR